MAYRTGIVLKMGAVMAQVDINSGVEKEEALKTVCVGTATPHPPTPIRQSVACPDCGNGLRDTYKKARVEGRSSFVLVEQTEVAETKANAVGMTKEIIELSAHPIEEVREQTIQGDGSVYYLTPSKPALAPLLDLLRDTLYRHPELAFMGLWTPSSRPNLYEIKLFGNTLVMETRARTETLKIIQQPAGDVAEVVQAQMDALLPTMTTVFDPATYADTYQEKLAALVAAREAVDGVAPTKSTGATVTALPGAVDLSALLQGALDSAGVKAPAKKATRKPRKAAA
jgi:non-homologous end joining protein Ku